MLHNELEYFVWQKGKTRHVARRTTADAAEAAEAAPGTDQGGCELKSERAGYFGKLSNGLCAFSHLSEQGATALWMMTSCQVKMTATASTCTL